MSLQTISIVKSLVFIFCFMLPPWFLIPKGMKYWEQWKKTKRPVLLSASLSAFMGAIYLFFMGLLITIMRFWGLA